MVVMLLPVTGSQATVTRGSLLGAGAGTRRGTLLGAGAGALTSVPGREKARTGHAHTHVTRVLCQYRIHCVHHTATTDS